MKCNFALGLPVSMTRTALRLSECHLMHLPRTKALNEFKENCIALSFLYIELSAISCVLHMQ